MRAAARAGRPPTRRRAGLADELEARLRRHFPEDAFGHDGRLRDFRDNLVGGVDASELPRRRGLEQHLRRVDSPLALALNSFLPWRGRVGELELGGRRGFTELRFLLLCPTGTRGTPPTVTVLARGPGIAVAVEPLGFDYLRPPQRRLAEVYRRLPLDSGLAAWRAALAEAENGSFDVTRLSMPRLFKLALALERNFPNAERRLVYLFLEPPQHARVEPFARHRRELAWLARRTEGATVEFRAEAFADLWERWRSRAPTPALREHARGLLARYHAPLTRRTGPVLVRLADG